MGTTSECSREGCAKPVRSRGLCSMHYSRMMRGTSLDTSPQPRNLYGPTCSVQDCERPHHSKGLCNRHHNAWRYASDPDFRARKLESERRRIARMGPVSRRESQRRQQLLRYGLTPEQYDEMLAAQDGVCAICKTPTPSALHVDHNHACCPGPRSCGSCIRGLLCANCNKALGLLRDIPEVFRTAATYLERSSTGVERSA